MHWHVSSWDGTRAVIRVDPYPGFLSLQNKNPVAEKAIQELEEELLRQESGGGPVNTTSLAVATARLNARLRYQSLSSRELWTQRSQFIVEQLPVSDHQTILVKHQQRLTTHPFIEKS